MANDNEYSDKVWFMASYHLALLCLYTESQYVSVHTKENGYMFLTFFYPSTACLMTCICYVARLFGVCHFFCLLRFSTD